MNRWATGTLLATAAACGGTAAPAPTVGPVRGRYDFRISLHVIQASVGGSRTEFRELRGQVEFDADTVFLAAEHGLCRPTEPPEPLAFGFDCDEIHYGFDRRNPLTRSKYLARIPVTRTRQGPCVEYSNQGARPVCIRYSTETYSTTQVLSGALNFHPAQR